ncbi:inositol monophosphatase family protein [Caulobacter segnis]|uniref:inositol monophosphatase family protein n=1 Tax=Caulobacter segnis TaxID=88688 RepID=UPI001CBACBB6|nr:inositol monophosphatase family protein [Caulobacter segnis]UAL12372.1 inositol monophosphatase [Caulobacter segnis]
MTEPSPLLRTMIRAARAAGDRLRQDFAEIATLEIQHKNGPADPFTIADVRAEQTVKSILSEAHPDYGFLGEEGGLVQGADPSNTWICDPLDGTANFLIGLPIWAVNVALQRDGEIVAGVTYVPMLDELFRAEKGGGAYLNDAPIKVSKRVGLEQAVLAVGIPFMGKPRQEQFHAEMQRLTPKVGGVRRLGAGAVDMAYVACGRFDAYWEQSVSAWDMAAGAVIVREAGGLVTDTLGRDLDVQNGTVLATTPQLLDTLLYELRPADVI